MKRYWLALTILVAPFWLSLPAEAKTDVQPPPSENPNTPHRQRKSAHIRLKGK